MSKNSNRCLVCNSTNTIFSDKSLFCYKCGASTSRTDSIKYKIDMWKRRKLSEHEIAVLASCGRMSSMKITNIAPHKNDIMRYIEIGCTPSEIAILFGTRLYIINNQLSGWGFSNNYGQRITKIAVE